jgi:hypothetical protein
MLSSTPTNAFLEGGAICFYGSTHLKKVKNWIWLYIKVLVWICRIAMGREKKLKKVCCDWKVRKQNLVTLELATKEQNVVALELATKEENVATS